MNKELRNGLLVSALAVLGTFGIAYGRLSPQPSSPQAQPISIVPTRTDQTFKILAEPLVAYATPSANETRDLEQALTQYRASRNWARPTAINAFLKKYPNSVWRVSLVTNEGLAQLQAGYVTEAIKSFRTAWHDGANAKTEPERAIRDRAYGQLLTLETGLGHVKQAKALIAAIGTYQLAGSASESLASAEDKLRELEHEPDIVDRCGPAALEVLAKLEKLPTKDQRIIERTKAHRYGTTLAQLVRLAAKVQMPSRAVYRSGNEPVPVPSVVHWKVDHYGTIVGEKDGLFHVKDPLFGGDHWLTRAAIENQSNGYFLVPNQTAEASSWRPVTEAEAAHVVGAGPTGTDNTRDTTKGDPKIKPPKKCGCTGMANYDAFLMLVSLKINDIPVHYTPPVGPAISIELSYIQREAYEPANFNFSNFGHKWTFNWQSYIQDTPGNPGNGVAIFFPGGGSRVYSGFNSTTDAFTPDDHTGAVLYMTSASPVTYEEHMPDGSVYVYGASDGSAASPRRVFLTKEIDPQGNAVTLSYDSQMRLTTITDAIGQQTTFSYTDANDPLKITAITDPFGRQATIDYDSSGRLIGLTDEIGLHSSFTYDSGTFITSMTTPYGTTNFSYSDEGNSTFPNRWLNITDPEGQTERVEYLEGAPGIGYSTAKAPNTNLIPVRNEWLNYRDTFYWDKSTYPQVKSLPAAQRYPKARIYHWLHVGWNDETAGTLESVKEPLQARVWYHYFGQVDSIRTVGIRLKKPNEVARVLDDGTTQLSKFAYNAQGNVTQKIDPNGRELDYIYALNGVDLTQVTRKTATGSDTIAQYTYNSQHEPLSYTDAAGQTTTYTYNAAGEQTSKTDPLGNTTTYAYDSDGYLTTITNADGKVAHSYTYDAYGRLASSTDSEGYTLQYSHDNLNRLTAITYPDGTQRQFTWDKLDPVAYTDRESHTTIYAYDSNRELVSKTSPEGDVTSYSYEPNGKLASITDPNGNATSWTHDIQGRVTREQYADGTTETYAYWPMSGDHKSATDALGQTKSYTYTHDDRLAQIQYLNAVNPTPSVSYTYDPYYPRLTGMTDGIGSTSFQYYPAGVLGANHLEYVQGPRTHDAISYKYDADGRLYDQTVDGAAQTFIYDAINRVTGDTNPLGSFTFKHLGETKQLTEQDIAGVPYRVGYDYESNINDRRLKDIYNQTVIHHMTRPVADFAYTTSPDDLILSRTESGGTTAGRRHRGWHIGHHYGRGHSRHWGVLAWLLGSEPGKDDDQHSAHHGDETGHENSGHGRGRDAMDPDSHHHHGDRDDDDGGQGGLVTNYTYDNDLRLTGASGGLTESYVYDSADNLSSITQGGTTTAISTNNVNEIQAAGSNSYVYDADGNVLDDGTYAYTWDAANRLISITNKATGHVSTFSYDGFSHRLADIETDSGAAPVETDYLWCGNSLCEKRDASGNVLARYYRQGELQGSTPYYYAQDENGSVVALVDGAGEVSGRMGYDSYGAVTNSTGVLPDYRYAGLWFHSASGKYLATYRAYSPDTGTWMSRDPIGMRGGLNLYDYAGSNPVGSRDPLGLRTCKGHWRQVGWIRTFNIFCHCVWICVPCHGSYAWSGNGISPNLPWTSGTVYYDPNKKGHEAESPESGNACSCSTPGPQTGGK